MFPVQALKLKDFLTKTVFNDVSKNLGKLLVRNPRDPNKERSKDCYRYLGQRQRVEGEPAFVVREIREVDPDVPVFGDPVNDADLSDGVAHLVIPAAVLVLKLLQDV